MVAYVKDTIVALATPPGRGSIGVIRLSGQNAAEIAARLLSSLPPPRHASYMAVNSLSGDLLDYAIVIFFVAPNSFTGEDVIEFQCHGGPVLLDAIIEQLINAGARLAQPGEFSQRAFLNEKLDLLQAEAISDLIYAGSRSALRSALSTLRGDFSRHISLIAEKIISLRIEVEASIDFSDEDIEPQSTQLLLNGLLSVIQDLEQLLSVAEQGRILCEGIRIVITGRPNAGKSSLLNLLTGHDSAIVTDIAGTTRDLVREYIQLDGLPIHLVDTAGLRDSCDLVEQEGIRRTWQVATEANLILYLVDDRTGLTDDDLSNIANLPQESSIVILFNKIDITHREVTSGVLPSGHTFVTISTLTAAGVPLLKDVVKSFAGYHESTSGLFMARRHHLQSLHESLRHLATALDLFTPYDGVLVAEEFRLALMRLGEITGEFTSDDLLGRIFSSFCIGK
jgi:tRNA modification GTPase